jgi:hypothetical protein
LVLVIEVYPELQGSPASIVIEVSCSTFLVDNASTCLIQGGEEVAVSCVAAGEDNAPSIGFLLNLLRVADELFHVGGRILNARLRHEVFVVEEDYRYDNV